MALLPVSIVRLRGRLESGSADAPKLKGSTFGGEVKTSPFGDAGTLPGKVGMIV
jgi:hypothetical protein